MKKKIISKEVIEIIQRNRLTLKIVNKREFPYSGDPLDLSQAEEIGEIVERSLEERRRGE